MHDAGEKDTPPSDRLVVARKPLLPAPCARFYPSTRFRSVSLSRALSVSTARTLTFRHFGRAAASGSSLNPRPPFLPIERYRGPQSIELRRETCSKTRGLRASTSILVRASNAMFWSIPDPPFGGYRDNPRHSSIANRSKNQIAIVGGSLLEICTLAKVWI